MFHFEEEEKKSLVLSRLSKNITSKSTVYSFIYLFIQHLAGGDMHRSIYTFLTETNQGILETVSISVNLPLLALPHRLLLTNLSLF